MGFPIGGKNVFRLTYWMKLNDCYFWYDWLKSRGVPAAIVHDTKREVWAVWRGPWKLESYNNYTVISSTNKDGWYPREFRIIQEANDFSKLPKYVRGG